MALFRFIDYQVLTMKKAILTLTFFLGSFAVLATTQTIQSPNKKTKVTTSKTIAAQTSRQPDVIFVPTPQDVVERMLELAEVQKGDVVYDLGSGDGRVVITAAKKFGAHAVGFDIDPERVQEGRENIAKEHSRRSKSEPLNARIEQADIFTLDLSKADVVFLYLLPSLNVKLLPQLADLKPGARVVSHSFGIEGIEPDQTISIRSEETGRTHEAFLWTAPIQKTQ